MLTVTVLDHLEETSIEETVLAGVARVVAIKRDTVAREAALAASDAVLMWHIERLTAADLAGMPKARIIQRVGMGFDNVDLQAARTRGIPVCNVPDYGTEDVADHAMTLLLSLCRGTWSTGLGVAGGPAGWTWFNAGRSNIRVRGLHLGLIGAGRIGTAVAMRAKAFGIRVSFYDPYVRDGVEKAIGVERVRQLTDLAECDAISIHAPLTDETKGLISASFFAASTKPIIIINTARGPIVDETAMCQAYSTGRVAGIGADVLEYEPIRPDHGVGRLLEDTPNARQNVLITPHCAFFSPQAYEELRRKAAENVRRCLVDGSHRNVVWNM